jgi:hypothetical protein
MKLEFSWQMFKKRPDGWKDRQTDRHDKANSRFSQFYVHTYKVNTVLNEIVQLLSVVFRAVLGFL